MKRSWWRKCPDALVSRLEYALWYRQFFLLLCYACGFNGRWQALPCFCRSCAKQRASIAGFVKARGYELEFYVLSEWVGKSWSRKVIQLKNAVRRSVLYIKFYHLSCRLQTESRGKGGGRLSFLLLCNCSGNMLETWTVNTVGALLCENVDMLRPIVPASNVPIGEKTPAHSRYL